LLEHSLALFNIVAEVPQEDGHKRTLLEVERLVLQPGEWVHVAGPNGSGKSTLAKLLTGHSGMIARGEALLAGTMNRGFAGNAPLPFVAQDPEAAIIGSTPWEDLLMGLEQQGMPAEEALRKAEISLQDCGLWELRGQSVAALSGGQKQLLAAAGCLASGAELLLFDEAAAMLDADSRRVILEGARKLHAHGKTIVWISHRLDELRSSDRIVALRAGKIFYDGPAEAFFLPMAGVDSGSEAEGSKQDGGDSSTMNGPCEKSPCEILGCEPPYMVETAIALQRLGYRLPKLPFSPEELAEAVSRL
jgi:energy-coupling factor transporter ATP-binding protein EcfA2